MSIIIGGAGSFSREVAGWLKMANAVVKGYVADDTAGVYSSFKDYQPQKGEEILMAISDPKVRSRLTLDLIDRGAVFHNMRMAVVSPSAQLGVGCILCPSSIMSAGAQIGDFVIVNLQSTVGHDVMLGNFCTLSCHVDLCGKVKVGDRCFFGSGARVLPGVTIGNDCIIGAGAIVGRDVPDGTTVYSEFSKTL